MTLRPKPYTGTIMAVLQVGEVVELVLLLNQGPEGFFNPNFPTP